MNLVEALTIFEYTDIEGLELDDLKKKYYLLAKSKHPDTQTGSQEDFVTLKEAYSFLQKAIKKHQIRNPRSLKEMTKEELIEKYNQDIDRLQNKIISLEAAATDQIDVLLSTKGTVEKLINESEYKKTSTKLKLEKDLEELEKKYKNQGLMGYLMFWTRVNEQEYLEKYSYVLKNYSETQNQGIIGFYKDIAKVYGDGLNKITEIIDQ